MESVTLDIRNYRGISVDAPLQIEIQDGISFILGVNNAGKTNLIRFLKEFRPILNFALQVNSNERRIHQFPSIYFDDIAHRKRADDAVSVTLATGDQSLFIQLQPHSVEHHTDQFIIAVSRSSWAKNDLDRTRYMNKLVDTLYIGAFRGAEAEINGETGDIRIGQSFINLWSQWAGGDDVRNRNKIEKLEEEIKELLGFKQFSIRLNDNKTTLLVRTDDGTFRHSRVAVNGLALKYLLLIDTPRRITSLKLHWIKF